ncbi:MULTISPECIES: glutamate-cysteine ligase family protein [unclassified Actinopolyspora]|uniref:glutamate-cysteine ligase family protein n=1 Tax=unclassified Actinopolyspora TaxID=2639451 RepID=UPI0013F5BA7C|nr:MULTISPECIES: glutamate-cysteine ligase family protein [unclassified Actinopolyspora]NHD18219.1 glutamate--cysteine ligase [Actinopolyspora sp. BKK2]NHE77102.1 glutamate--cysteine ligase [Actinopolyspora sp. BKK1]
MGRYVADQAFRPGDRQRYRDKMQRGLDALARMLAEDNFSFPHQQMGLEMELSLVDEVMNPSMSNAEVLEKIDNPSFTTELGQHNIEFNVPPRMLAGRGALELEEQLRASLVDADAKAHDNGAKLVMIGTLPTLRSAHFDPRWLSRPSRYGLLNQQICAARGEEILLHMAGSPLGSHGQERLRSHAESILPTSACTSVQLHLQVSPDEFAAHWNAAQCLAGAQIAVGANSPFLLGKALWQETRVPLFQQATDSRPEELKNQGVRPRVWFGERWITSIFDLFEENVRYFPALMPESEEEDPVAALDAGRAPNLSELLLHNSTVWRWNRPVYDLVDGVPHLRVENRVLPSGPTVIDVLANAAFFYGAQRALAEQDRPLWTKISFATAEENFYNGARHGMNARLYWPGLGWLPAHELMLRELLPLAHEGLKACGVSDAVRERHLGVLEQRCRARQTGADWQRNTVLALQEHTDRQTALVEMLRRYTALGTVGEPVHTWPTE